jgi:aspartyl-tRNA(Asn)/glutamyl-tRNA(Gln) amidotransferase subunit A
LRQRYHARVAGFDAVILPSAPILPPNAHRLMSDDTYYVSENLLALRNTRIGNLMGSCALTLPTGHPSCGLMVQCDPGRDERLLRMGLSIERVMQG